MGEKHLIHAQVDKDMWGSLTEVLWPGNLESTQAALASPWTLTPFLKKAGWW